MSSHQRIVAASFGLVFAILLHLADALFHRHYVSLAHSVFDDAVLAGLGAMCVLLYSRYLHERYEAQRLRELSIINAEMNHHIRNGVTMLAGWCDLGEKPDPQKLRDAVSRINFALEHLLPTAQGTTSPRYFPQDPNPRP